MVNSLRIQRKNQNAEERVEVQKRPDLIEKIESIDRCLTDRSERVKNIGRYHEMDKNSVECRDCELIRNFRQKQLVPSEREHTKSNFPISLVSLENIVSDNQYKNHTPFFIESDRILDNKNEEENIVLDKMNLPFSISGLSLESANEDIESQSDKVLHRRLECSTISFGTSTDGVINQFLSSTNSIDERKTEISTLKREKTDDKEKERNIVTDKMILPFNISGLSLESANEDNDSQNDQVLQRRLNCSTISFGNSTDEVINPYLSLPKSINERNTEISTVKREKTDRQFLENGCLKHKIKFSPNENGHERKSQIITLNDVQLNNDPVGASIVEIKELNKDIQRVMTLASSITTLIPFPLEKMGELLEKAKSEGISSSLIVKLFKDSFPVITFRWESVDNISMTSDNLITNNIISSVSTMESLDVEEDIERYLAKFTPPVGLAIEELITTDTERVNSIDGIKKLNKDIQRAMTLAASITTQIPFPMEKMGELLEQTKAEDISPLLIEKLFKDSFPMIPSRSGNVEDDSISSVNSITNNLISSISTMESIDNEENIEKYLVKFTPPVGATIEELQILNSYLKEHKNEAVSDEVKSRVIDPMKGEVINEENVICFNSSFNLIHDSSSNEKEDPSGKVKFQLKNRRTNTESNNVENSACFNFSIYLTKDSRSGETDIPPGEVGCQLNEQNNIKSNEEEYQSNFKSNEEYATCYNSSINLTEDPRSEEKEASYGEFKPQCTNKDDIKLNVEENDAWNNSFHYLTDHKTQTNHKTNENTEAKHNEELSDSTEKEANNVDLSEDKLFKESFPSTPSRSGSVDGDSISSYYFMPTNIVPSGSTMESLDIDEDIERYLAKFSPPVGATIEELQILNSYLKEHKTNMIDSKKSVSFDVSASNCRIVSIDIIEFRSILRSLLLIEELSFDNSYELDIDNLQNYLLKSFEEILGHSIHLTEFPPSTIIPFSDINEYSTFPLVEADQQKFGTELIDAFFNTFEITFLDTIFDRCGLGPCQNSSITLSTNSYFICEEENKVGDANKLEVIDELVEFLVTEVESRTKEVISVDKRYQLCKCIHLSLEKRFGTMELNTVWDKNETKNIISVELSQDGVNSNVSLENSNAQHLENDNDTQNHEESKELLTLENFSDNQKIDKLSKNGNSSKRKLLLLFSVGGFNIFFRY